MAMPAGALIAGPLGTAIGISRAQYAAAAVIVVASALALIPRNIRTIRSSNAPVPPVLEDRPTRRRFPRRPRNARRRSSTHSLRISHEMKCPPWSCAVTLTWWYQAARSLSRKCYRHAGPHVVGHGVHRDQAGHQVVQVRAAKGETRDVDDLAEQLPEQ